MDQKSDKEIRKQLIKNIEGGQAFMALEKVLKMATYDKISIVPDKLPYSFYQVFHHMRMAQKDIIDYSTSSEYNTPNWPDDYWPTERGPKNKEDWEGLKETFFKERKAFCDYLENKEHNLLAPFQKENEHHLLREAQLIIEHNAYHTGQLLVILRLLSIYE